MFRVPAPKRTCQGQGGDKKNVIFLLGDLAQDLCDKPLGAADYLAIGQAFHTIFIADIPRLTMQVWLPGLVDVMAYTVIILYILCFVFFRIRNYMQLYKHCTFSILAYLQTHVLSYTVFFTRDDCICVLYVIMCLYIRMIGICNCTAYTYIYIFCLKKHGNRTLANCVSRLSNHALCRDDVPRFPTKSTSNVV